jgi:hypothetical protein
VDELSDSQITSEEALPKTANVSGSRTEVAQQYCDRYGGLTNAI